MSERSIRVILSGAEIELLLEALDAYEYWQPGDVLPRKNGVVFIPGDLLPGWDRYWDDQLITAEQLTAIQEVWACRALSSGLREAAQDFGLEEA